MSVYDDIVKTSYIAGVGVNVTDLDNNVLLYTAPDVSKLGVDIGPINVKARAQDNGTILPVATAALGWNWSAFILIAAAVLAVVALAAWLIVRRGRKTHATEK
jgi:hypothetical protein